VRSDHANDADADQYGPFINADLNFVESHQHSLLSFHCGLPLARWNFSFALPPKDGLFINTHLLRKLFLKQSQFQSPFPKMIA
jgi:hypothetical protein